MVTVVGSLNMDLVINTVKIPRPGETVMGKDFKQVPGGKGGNQACAIARLGTDVQMIGCIGKDHMGHFLKNTLEADGVGTKHIFEKENISTGVAAIVVDESGTNLITVAPGANYELTVEDVHSKKEVIQEADLLLLQLETKLDVVEHALKLAREFGKKTILNPAPAAPLSELILKDVDILTPNETELETLTGCQTDTEEKIIKAGKKLIESGVKELVVTLGEKGCIYITESRTQSFAAYKVKSVDTTAAGDAFNGALAVSLSRGESMEKAIEFAMKVGAMTVTKEGAQTSLPYKEEVNEFNSWLKEKEK